MKARLALLIGSFALAASVVNAPAYAVTAPHKSGAKNAVTLANFDKDHKKKHWDHKKKHAYKAGKPKHVHSHKPKKTT